MQIQRMIPIPHLENLESRSLGGTIWMETDKYNNVAATPITFSYFKMCQIVKREEGKSQETLNYQEKTEA